MSQLGDSSSLSAYGSDVTLLFVGEKEQNKHLMPLPHSHFSYFQLRRLPEVDVISVYLETLDFIYLFIIYFVQMLVQCPN